MSVVRSTPPPVPPRPSRTVIDEALAKSRQSLPNQHTQQLHQNVAQNVTQNVAQNVVQNVVQNETVVVKKIPVRSAPPPPTNKPQISPLNSPQNSPQNSRTVIYQSPKIPPNPIEHLIDVIVQSNDKSTTIIVAKDDDNNNKKVQFDDKLNAEYLIAELQNMKHEKFEKHDKHENFEKYDKFENHEKIEKNEWIEVANGEEVRLSSCQIYIHDQNNDPPSTKLSKSSSFSSCGSSKKLTSPVRAPSMSSLHGLPPLPKSLSGFSLVSTTNTSINPGIHPGINPGINARTNGQQQQLQQGRKVTTLDTQLAVLRREMYGLRQLDLSLLSQLYSLNEAIQDFRQILQDQEDSALSPNSPSPSPSSGDEGDEFYSPAPLRYKPAPPAPPLRRTSNSSSANSSEYGTV